MRFLIPFTKASGAGNDFVIVDRMREAAGPDAALLARILCSRPFGIGADGLLVIVRQEGADFGMEYYNADGSFGGMCGNGGRCAAMYAYRAGYAPAKMQFTALGYTYDAAIGEETVRLKMKPPTDFRDARQLSIRGAELVYQFVNTGSPHAIVYTDNLEQCDVAGLGRAIRHHSDFAPQGTNVNFVSRLDDFSIAIRTYERGVEAETYACGTGSVASAIMSRRSLELQAPVHVHVRSGEELIVHFDSSQEVPTDVFLEGSAHMLFSGKVFVDDVKKQIEPVEA